MINPGYLAEAAFAASRAVEIIVNVRGEPDPSTGKRHVVAVRTPEEIAIIGMMVRIALESAQQADGNLIKNIIDALVKDRDLAKKVAATIAKAQKEVGKCD